MLLLLPGFGLMAQPDGDQERLEAMKVAFITKTLELTVEESQQFWPLYNEYQQDLETIRARTDRAGTDPRSMGEAEAQNYIQKVLEEEEARLDLKKEYYGRLKGVLPATKLARLPYAERSFRKELLNRYKNRREGAGARQGERLRRRGMQGGDRP